jgi:hypothetical protein
MIFRARQIGLAFCLLASLLVSHVPACVCSHHQETAADEIDCHAAHEAAAGTDTATDQASVDTDCICVVEQSASSTAVRPSEKKSVLGDTAAALAEFTQNPEIAPMAGGVDEPPAFVRTRLYSSIQKSLLPARAPPRL